jgi:hypothetical protein
MEPPGNPGRFSVMRTGPNVLLLGSLSLVDEMLAVFDTRKWTLVKHREKSVGAVSVMVLDVLAAILPKEHVSVLPLVMGEGAGKHAAASAPPRPLELNGPGGGGQVRQRIGQHDVCRVSGTVGVGST